MKIIISPAKTMRVDREAYEVKGLPRFLEETRILMEAIKKLSFDAVSYTHLDVYKRQGYDIMEKSRESSIQCVLCRSL